MDNIKYQVFISSTYADLANERKKVLDILLMADCIPAGMENFVATDDEQFNVIKRVIDLCDYYILIIGKRYGTVNEATGISYTEMEYNYAIDRGIPVLVFALDNDAEISSDKTESDDIKKGKLAEFKIRAMRNRLASIWKDESDLMGKVAIAIMQAKTEIKRPGWHRGNDVEKETLLKQISYLEKELERLKSKDKNELELNSQLYQKFYGCKILLHYTEELNLYNLSTDLEEIDVQTTLDELFMFISLRIKGIKNAKAFDDAMNAFQRGYNIEEQNALIVRNKYEQLGLIETLNGKDNVEMIRLTKLGIEIMNKLNS